MMEEAEEENNIGINIRKSQKLDKTDRKVIRAINKISKDVGGAVIFSKNPTNILILCNCGHVTNASHESIFELFSTYGEILDVSLVPGKAFCFVTFANKVIAQAALEDINGKKSLSSSEVANKTPVYVTYIDHIPDQFKTKFYIWTMSKMPDGLYLYQDFIDENEEKAILDGFKWPSDQDQPAGSSLMKNRQVQHFGKEFIYGSNSIQAADHIEPFPDHWSPIIQRSIDQGIEKRWPDQCTVNRYAPGHGIPAHVDNHACCDDTIVSLSLGSEVVMNFVDLDDPNKKSIPVSLKPRSLLAMTGRSRYTYSHGIVPRKADIVPLKTGDRTTLTLRPRHERVSLTFRKSTSEPCSCTYPQHCSSRMKENVDQIDQITASKLEKEHVHQVYEQIASHFSETRHKPWPLVMSFLDQHLSPGSILVDIGCGNGKYLGHHLDVVGIGFDYSRQLLTFVRQKGLDAIRSDALNIPLKSGIADALINIAVIHHLSTKERRASVIEEFVRVLRIGGRGLIYAWAKNQQDKDCQPSTYMQQNQKKPSSIVAANDLTTLSDAISECKITAASAVSLPVHENRTNFKHSDLLVPWKTKPTNENNFSTATYHRFYHVFEEGELENLIQESAVGKCISIEKSYYDQGNWCVIFMKTS